MLSLLAAAVLLSPTSPEITSYTVQGWVVHVNNELLENEPDATDKALTLIDRQLREIVRVVPAPAVSKLRRVRLWLSSTYKGVSPRAEYHVSNGWLRDNGRNPKMVRGVEFTNIPIFEEETRRMPMMVLHELAHTYHHQFRKDGFQNAEILELYNRAKKSGTYDKVEVRDQDGRSALAPAYAMTNQQEYFAENSEAFFGRNDYFPFTSEELEEHDPEMYELLDKLWNLP